MVIRQPGDRGVVEDGRSVGDDHQIPDPARLAPKPLRGPDAEVRIDLRGAPKGEPEIARYLVDETHSNAFTAWQAMGSPQEPTEEQLAELEEACKLVRVKESPRFIEEENLSAVMMTLPRQGVSLVELVWK